MKFYSQTGEEIHQAALQDKSMWCLAGERQEQAFVRRYGAKLGLVMNPEKASNKYAPDLLHRCGRLADLKTRNTPFFLAQHMYKHDPQHAITINCKDINHYAEKYPDILIYFGVEWLVTRADLGSGSISVEPMLGVWGVRFTSLFDMCELSPIHTYGQRKNDTAGNGKDSYVISLNSFKRLV